MSLCKYKDIFGKPGEGIHAYRIPVINLATVDVAVVVATAYGISQYCSISFYVMIVILFIIGIVAHKVFCVNTQLNKYLGLADNKSL